MKINQFKSNDLKYKTKLNQYKISINISYRVARGGK